MNQKPGMFEKVENYAALIGLVATLILLPVDRLPYLHHIPFNLGLVSLVILAFAALSTLYRRLKSSGVASVKPYALIATILVLPAVVFALSTTYAINKGFAREATTDLATAVFRAFCCVVVLNEKRNLWPVMKRTLYALTAAIVLFGFFQFFFDVFGASTAITDLRGCCTSNSTYVFPRVHSVSIEPLYFAHFLMLPLWLLIHDLLAASRRFSLRDRKMQLLIAAATLFVLSSARSAFFGMIISSVFFAFALARQGDFKKKLMAWLKPWVAAIFIALLLILMSGLVAVTAVKKTSLYGATSGAGSVALFTTHSLSVADDSAITRYGTWPNALKFFKQKPIGGVGAYNSRIKLNESQYKKGVPITRLQPFNNDYLGLVVDLGLLMFAGFLPLLLMLIGAYKFLFKGKMLSPLAPFGLAAIGMLAQALFFHSILLSRTWFVLGMMALYLTDRKYYSKPFKKARN